MSEQEQRVVTCPACERRFRLPPTGGPRLGQRLRCGRCGHIFRLETTDPAHSPNTRAQPAAAITAAPGTTAEDDSPPPDRTSEDTPASQPPTDIPEDEKDEDDEDNEETAAADAPPRAAVGEADAGDNHAQATAESADAVLRALRARNRGRGRRPGAGRARAGGFRRLAIGLGWLAWVAVVGGVVWLVLAAPADWRRHWPLLARAHALFVSEETPAGAPLTLSLAQHGIWEETPQGWRLTVDGRVRNRSAHTQVIPPIIVLLRDGTGRIRAKAIARPATARVAGHGTVSFTARLERIRLDGGDTAGLTLVAEFARIEPRDDTAASSPSPAGQPDSPLSPSQENGHGAHPGR